MAFLFWWLWELVYWRLQFVWVLCLYPKVVFFVHVWEPWLCGDVISDLDDCTLSDYMICTGVAIIRVPLLSVYYFLNHYKSGRISTMPSLHFLPGILVCSTTNIKLHVVTDFVCGNVKASMIPGHWPWTCNNQELGSVWRGTGTWKGWGKNMHMKWYELYGHGLCSLCDSVQAYTSIHCRLSSVVHLSVVDLAWCCLWYTMTSCG